MHMNLKIKSPYDAWFGDLYIKYSAEYRMFSFVYPPPRALDCKISSRYCVEKRRDYQHGDLNFILTFRDLDVRSRPKNIACLIDATAV